MDLNNLVDNEGCIVIRWICVGGLEMRIGKSDIQTSARVKSIKKLSH